MTKPRSFADAAHLFEYLHEERQKIDRFATRFIIVDGLSTWKDISSQLATEVDQVIYLSELCQDPDIFPDLEEVTTKLSQIKKPNSTIAIFPVAEYARLSSRGSDFLRLLAEWSGSNIRRIYVPLLGSEDILDEAIGFLGRFQEGLLPERLRLFGIGRAEVIVAGFVQDNVGDSKKGIQSYFSHWEQGGSSRVWLVTDFASCLKPRYSGNDCRVKLYPSGFIYISEQSRWTGLQLSYGKDDQWDWLASQWNDGDTLQEVAQKILGIVGFYPDRIFPLWLSLDQDQRWLAWLWGKSLGMEGYLGEVFEKGQNVNDFIDDCVMTIFSLNPSRELVKERKQLLSWLQVSSMPQGFWDRWSDIADNGKKIIYLTDLSSKEREQLVLCIGQLLQDRKVEYGWWSYLEVIWPTLAWYLTEVELGDGFISKYFFHYNRSRVRDRMDEELSSLAKQAADEQYFWRFPSRESLLTSRREAGRTGSLWLDGMGVEWAGALTNLINEHSNLQIKLSIAKVKLPSTTENNKGWVSEDEVIRDLDNDGHRSNYSYPRSFIKDFETIQKAAKRVKELLVSYDEVVITADHGLTRFNGSGGKGTTPDGASVKEYGRFAVMNTIYQPSSSPSWTTADGNAVMLTHEKFEGAAGTAGQVHGGATLEECLVPVIRVKRERTNEKVNIREVSELVKINARGEGNLNIRVDKALSSLRLTIAGRNYPGMHSAENRWQFEIRDLSTGTYTGHVYTGERYIGMVEFQVARGIQTDDMGL